MSLVEEAQGHVSAAKSPLETVAANVAQAHEVTDKLAAESRERGYDAKAGQAAAIRDALGELHTVLTDSSSTLDDVHAKLDALKGLVAAGGAGRASPALKAGPPRLRDFAPQRPAADGTKAVERLGWPRNAEGRISARGLLYDRDGRPLIEKPLRAVKRGPAADGSDLVEPWRSDERYTPRWHVEGHTAAWMRRNGVTEASLYLNTPPCGGPAPGGEADPLRCEANLAHLLPRGTKLHIHSVDEQGRTRSKSYTGTGEALRDDR